MGSRKRLQPADPNNIVTTWINVELSLGNSVKEAMEGLNQRTGNHYAPDRAYMWERGRSLPGRDVYDYMLERTLPVVLSELKLKKSVVKKVSQKLTMPKNSKE